MQVSEESLWRGEHSIDTKATAQTIWKLFCDVPGWKRWNAGIEQIEITGPFTAGTVFYMRPPGQETLTTRLVEVRPNESFVDETSVGDLLVRVAHSIQPLGNGRTRVIYSVEAIGPGAAEIGPLVSADFPDVLKSLSALAESSEGAV
jgi:carbon monoxide dehydrogenase subunit G